MERKSLRVLVLEDDEGDFFLVRKALRAVDEEIQLFNARSLLEAQEFLRKELYDLILTDLYLPDSVGLKTLRKLLEIQSVIPVVVLSGLEDEELGLAAIQCGAQDFLNKNELKGSILKRVIRYAVERKTLDQLKDDFVSNVSHELRTPLAVIKERVDQVHKELLGDINDKQQRALSSTARNVERLEYIINNLLDLAQIDAGKMGVHFVEADIVSIIRDVCEELSFKVEKKQLALFKNLPQNKIFVNLDKVKIYQVLINLLNNAIKFTETGTITVNLLEKGSQVECSIIDTGRGMTEQQLKSLFNKFEQFDPNLSPEEKGSGLGLAICRGLIELHEGFMTVKSIKGQGSTFTFTLPKSK